MPVTPESPAPTHAAQLDLLMPLHYFYAQDEAPIPPLEFIRGCEVPEPMRHLLVHESDMTPRLRTFHQSEISLTVIQAEIARDFVMRQVVLCRTTDGAPVEYGAIGIQLEGLPAHVQALIRKGEKPLGAILEQESVPHVSSPRAWFEIRADDHIANLLQVAGEKRLYGRSNALTHPGGIVFADIVEILP
jgi:chorismate-pyruvate lyase